MFTEKTWERLAQYGDNLLTALLVLAAGLLLTKLVLKVAHKVLDKSSLDESVYKFLLKTIKYGLYLLIFVVVLTCLHVPTAPLVTVLGACGAAIALALKDSLGNIASGIIILVNQPFIRGDVIEVAGVTGIVQSIDLMVTTLRTYDNKSISIPNGTMTASVLINHTRETTRRVDCKFGVSYDADIAKVKDILMSVSTLLSLDAQISFAIGTPISRAKYAARILPKFPVGTTTFIGCPHASTPSAASFR